ncbi:MAG: hypothetical protein R3C32_12915 [Chloroflexota bacterium]
MGDDEALDAALEVVGAPSRLGAFGGYDGRSQVRIATCHRRMAMDSASSGRAALLEREVLFRAELLGRGRPWARWRVSALPVAWNARRGHPRVDRMARPRRWR